MNWRFERDVTVEGVPYKKGQVADGNDLSAGCVESMRSVGWITACDDNPKQASKKADVERPKRKRVTRKPTVGE